MPRFYVWPDGLPEERGRWIEADSADSAAEHYAEMRFREDHADEMEVLVRDEAGATRSFTVDLDIEVSAFATENPMPAPEVA